MSKEEMTPLQALRDMLEYLLTYDEFNEKRHKHNAHIIEEELKESESWERDYFELKEVLKIIKELLNLKVVEFLPNDSDTRLFVNCGNFKASVLIPPAYIDLLKEVLL